MFVLQKAVNIVNLGAITSTDVPFDFLANKAYKVKITIAATSTQIIPYNIKLDAVTMHSGNIDLTNLTDWANREYTLNPTANRANLQINFTGGQTGWISAIEIYQDITTEEIQEQQAEQALADAETEEDRRKKALDVIVILTGFYVKKYGQLPAIIPDANDSLDNLLVLINTYKTLINK